MTNEEKTKENAELVCFNTDCDWWGDVADADIDDDNELVCPKCEWGLI